MCSSQPDRAHLPAPNVRAFSRAQRSRDGLFILAMLFIVGVLLGLVLWHWIGADFPTQRDANGFTEAVSSHPQRFVGHNES